ncbi:MAG TPA: hypothetical protein VGX25_30320 [Actinophytocola sp.]|uniref:hypothetical protein n=1 Tax=Actinophytocola sp. TaxID=1872138 RepID=UPI002DDD2363|nr:hypothetical protein [Actinophytocola sp.]HEV2783704.1 hypothetical protein [Actinophytocola sp.]
MRLPPASILAALLVVGGCAGDPAAGHDGHGAQPQGAAAPAKVMTVQELADTVGCRAKVTVKGADFRQATCSAPGADVVLLDFDTAEGQRAWVDGAKSYGGVYLVGNRWALSGMSADFMRSMQGLLGGAIEFGEEH